MMQKSQMKCVDTDS